MNPALVLCLALQTNPVHDVQAKCAPGQVTITVYDSDGAIAPFAVVSVFDAGTRKPTDSDVHTTCYLPGSANQIPLVNGTATGFGVADMRGQVQTCSPRTVTGWVVVHVVHGGHEDNCQAFFASHTKEFDVRMKAVENRGGRTRRPGNYPEETSSACFDYSSRNDLCGVVAVASCCQPCVDVEAECSPPIPATAPETFCTPVPLCVTSDIGVDASFDLTMGTQLYNDSGARSARYPVSRYDTIEGWATNDRVFR